MDIRTEAKPTPIAAVVYARLAETARLAKLMRTAQAMPVMATRLLAPLASALTIAEMGRKQMSIAAVLIRVRGAQAAWLA